MGKRKKIKSSLSEYFNFSARERRGSLLLAVILVIQIFVLYYLQNRENYFPSPDKEIISALLAAKNVRTTDSLMPITNRRDTNKTVSYFHFDPNSLDEPKGLKLGLSKKQINVITNYRNHGGKFRLKSDFKKMYCLSAEEYKKLEPYITLPDSISRKIPESISHVKKRQIIEIDVADSILLMDLRGIGPVLASRIVRYREKLGGFNSIDQLKEVWGISDSLYNAIYPFIELKTKIPFRYIHLNSDSFNVLSSHPYIKSKIAGLICNYRKQHLRFAGTEELKQIPLVTDENFLKLAPYLQPD